MGNFIKGFGPNGEKITFTGQLLNYARYKEYSDTFIETGTAMGDGVQRALDAGFVYIMSVEAWVEYYRACVARFAKNDNVAIVPGNSVDALPSMLKNIPRDKGAVIYLDAHPTGPGSAGHHAWEEGDPESFQHTIIKKELDVILAHGRHHVIIIDDVNGMEDGCAEEYMRKILEVWPGCRFEFWDECLSGNPEFYYKDKILVCLP